MTQSFARQTYRFLRSVVRRLRDTVLRSESLFRAYLRWRFGVRFPPHSLPEWPLSNCVLKSHGEWEAALSEVRSRRLPRHPDGPKNWDTLKALVQILSETQPNAHVLDAGAELYSSLLPSLYAFGYRNLTGINLVFSRKIRRGPIRYEHGDITRTRFANGHFDAIACLSVVEHGVNLREFFTEMARVLKPGGVLVVSTDFWEAPVNTQGKTAFGVPVHVFTRLELMAAVNLAHECGLDLAAGLDLDCVEKAVRWDDYGLEYTFVALTLRKSPQRVAIPTASHQLERAVLTPDS